ncbi:hypothetical protein MMB75_25465 [Paenibacillus sp. P2(2022)]|uniref:hypothetical protein n=1 Tax=Paenibacillus TaxID=44249 RepID=UPI00240688BD|nr:MULTISPECIES: hypothetical protein [Paenibacillus]MDG0056978.1 hypothetical protein [Paenibacillus sp. P2(2022)]WHX37396.1 hypothetical protein QNH38_08115 [Paenibacillus polymyxa]
MKLYTDGTIEGTPQEIAEYKGLSDDKLTREVRVGTVYIGNQPLFDVKADVAALRRTKLGS